MMIVIGNMLYYNVGLFSENHNTGFIVIGNINMICIIKINNSFKPQINDKDALSSKPETYKTQQPGSIEYARDEALGGHIACLLSLLVNEKMLLHVEIPDNLVECDSEVVEKLKAGDAALSRSPVKEPKRKTQDANVEDLLEKEEDMAMGDSDDGDEEAISAMSQDDLEGEVWWCTLCP